MDLALALRAFNRVIERGSITAAARDLGLSQPAVSKILRNLEDHTGSRLLERNSRALRPTLSGRSLYETSGGALSNIDAAIEAVRKDANAISGVLRLHGPACVGESHLNRIALDFQNTFPAVSIELILENKASDLIRENFDLAIRMEPPADQTLIARRIGASTRILAASPDYLARHQPVASHHDLAGHGMIVTDASLSRQGTLVLTKGDEDFEIELRPRLKTNSASVLVQALLAGSGIGTTQILLVDGELRDRRLVRVLPDYSIEPTELFVVYPSAKFLRPTVRAFIDFAVPRLQKVDGIVAN